MRDLCLNSTAASLRTPSMIILRISSTLAFLMPLKKSPLITLASKTKSSLISAKIITSSAYAQKFIWIMENSSSSLKADINLKSSNSLIMPSVITEAKDPTNIKSIGHISVRYFLVFTDRIC